MFSRLFTFDFRRLPHCLGPFWGENLGPKTFLGLWMHDRFLWSFSVEFATADSGNARIVRKFWQWSWSLARKSKIPNLLVLKDQPTSHFAHDMEKCFFFLLNETWRFASAKFSHATFNLLQLSSVCWTRQQIFGIFLKISQRAAAIWGGNGFIASWDASRDLEQQHPKMLKLSTQLLFP